jgi:hypothetical protein
VPRKPTSGFSGGCSCINCKDDSRWRASGVVVSAWVPSGWAFSGFTIPFVPSNWGTFFVSTDRRNLSTTYLCLWNDDTGIISPQWSMTRKNLIENMHNYISIPKCQWASTANLVKSKQSHLKVKCISDPHATLQEYSISRWLVQSIHVATSSQKNCASMAKKSL